MWNGINLNPFRVYHKECFNKVKSKTSVSWALKSIEYKDFDKSSLATNIGSYILIIMGLIFIFLSIIGYDAFVGSKNLLLFYVIILTLAVYFPLRNIIIINKIKNFIK